MAEEESILDEIIEKRGDARFLGAPSIIYEHSAYGPECLRMRCQNQLSKGGYFRCVQLHTRSCTLRNGSVCRVEAGEAK